MRKHIYTRWFLFYRSLTPTKIQLRSLWSACMWTLTLTVPRRNSGSASLWVKSQYHYCLIIVYFIYLLLHHKKHGILPHSDDINVFPSRSDRLVMFWTFSWDIVVNMVCCHVICLTLCPQSVLVQYKTGRVSPLYHSVKYRGLVGYWMTQASVRLLWPVIDPSAW